MTKWFQRNRGVTSTRIQRVFILLIGFLGIFKLSTLAYYQSRPPSSLARPLPTVGKVTVIYGNSTVYERGLRTHIEHSNRHSYPLSVLRTPILEGTFNKYAALLSKVLAELEKPPEERLQWILWFDSDTVLMNPNMPLEVFLPPPRLSNIHLLLSKDWNGMNNGVFFIRVNQWSVALLSAAMSYPILHPDVPLFWPDQSALSNLLKENQYFEQSTVYCPLRWFNAYMRSPDGLSPNKDSPKNLQIHPGDLLVHFPGTRKENLNNTLTPYLEIAESHQAEWEPLLEQTNYIEETAAFWNKKTG